MARSRHFRRSNVRVVFIEGRSIDEKEALQRRSSRKQLVLKFMKKLFGLYIFPMPQS